MTLLIKTVHVNAKPPFWREEGDYLLLSAVPQVLMDRSYIKSRTDVGQWLASGQRVDASKAILLATKRSRGIPRFMDKGTRTPWCFRLRLSAAAWYGHAAQGTV